MKTLEWIKPTKDYQVRFLPTTTPVFQTFHVDPSLWSKNTKKPSCTVQAARIYNEMKEIAKKVSFDPGPSNDIRRVIAGIAAARIPYLYPGNPCGEVLLSVQKGRNMSQKPPKHPNRVKTQTSQNKLRLKDFRHLKKGHLYKMSVGSSRWGFPSSAFFYKGAGMESGSIAVLDGCMTAMYLETVFGPYQTGWHRCIVGDQVGWVKASDVRFKQITQRQLRRAEKQSKADSNETENQETE